MNYKKPYEFLRSLSYSLNNFYKKKSKKNLIISNKSKNKKNYDPVTNFDKNFEKLIRAKIQKKRNNPPPPAANSDFSRFLEGFGHPPNLLL